MSLISCPECGKQISDKAETCIHCNASLTDLNKPKEHQNKTKGDLKSDKEKIKVRKASNIGPNIAITIIIIIFYIPVVFVYNRSVPEPIKEVFTTITAQFQEDESRSVNSNVGDYQSSSESETQHAPSANVLTEEDRIARKIVSRSYNWYEDGLSVSLSFQYEDNPNSGTMVLSGPTHTLSFRIDGDRSFVGAALYPNRPCSITYNYTIRGNYINADFVSSTCDYDGNGKNLVYDESRNSISIYTNEGEMILK